METRSFAGLDVHKATISISIAEDGRSGPVRFIGVIPNTAEAVAKMAKRSTGMESSTSVTKQAAAGTASIAN